MAYLVPAEEPQSNFPRMVSAGQVRLAGGDLRDILPPPAAEPGTRPLSEVLQEMRDEERY